MKLVIDFCSSAALEKVVIDIGTLCSLSERFCAVTITSSSPPACDVGSAAAFAAPAAASHTPAISIFRGSRMLMASPPLAALVAARHGYRPAATHRLSLRNHDRAGTAAGPARALPASRAADRVPLGTAR